MMEVDNQAIDYLLGLLGEKEDSANIYLAHLLFSNSRDAYRNDCKNCLYPNPSDFVQVMQEATDPSIRYFLWKVNADHILIHLAIWYDVGVESPPPYDRFHFRDPDAYMQLCADYYRTAAHLHGKLYVDADARTVGKVLWALGSELGMYITRLRLARKNYLLFLNEYEDEDFGRFVEGL